jgi:protein-S-isoprenylcysteine O-methyltransferase Ste14
MTEMSNPTSESRMDLGAAFITFVPPIAFAVIMIAAVHRAPWTPLRITGAVMAVLGLLFLTVARLQLGNSFSVTPQAKRLVTHGLYSRIRHPVYIFGWLAISGFILYMNQPRFLLLMALLVPMQVARARAEEKVLAQHFGEAYTTYRAGTWF